MNQHDGTATTDLIVVATTRRGEHDLLRGTIDALLEQHFRVQHVETTDRSRLADTLEAAGSAGSVGVLGTGLGAALAVEAAASTSGAVSAVVAVRPDAAGTVDHLDAIERPLVLADAREPLVDSLRRAVGPLGELLLLPTTPRPLHGHGLPDPTTALAVDWSVRHVAGATAPYGLLDLVRGRAWDGAFPMNRTERRKLERHLRKQAEAELRATAGVRGAPVLRASTMLAALVAANLPMAGALAAPQSVAAQEPPTAETRIDLERFREQLRQGAAEAREAPTKPRRERASLAQPSLVVPAGANFTFAYGNLYGTIHGDDAPIDVSLYCAPYDPYVNYVAYNVDGAGPYYVYDDTIPGYVQCSDVSSIGVDMVAMTAGADITADLSAVDRQSFPYLNESYLHGGAVTPGGALTLHAPGVYSRFVGTPYTADTFLAQVHPYRNAYNYYGYGTFFHFDGAEGDGYQDLVVMPGTDDADYGFWYQGASVDYYYYYYGYQRDFRDLAVVTSQTYEYFYGRAWGSDEVRWDLGAGDDALGLWSSSRCNYYQRYTCEVGGFPGQLRLEGSDGYDSVVLGEGRYGGYGYGAGAMFGVAARAGEPNAFEAMGPHTDYIGVDTEQVHARGDVQVDDSLTLEASALDTPLQYVSFDGGYGPDDDLILDGTGQTAPLDELQFSFDGAPYNPGYGYDGDISIGDLRVRFSGLEPITDSLDAVDKTFAFSGADDDVTVGQSAVGADYVEVASNGTSETVDSKLPSGSLTILGGSGNDSIDASTSPMGVTLDGGDGDDVLQGSTHDDTFRFQVPPSGPETDTIIEDGPSGGDTVDFSALTTATPVTSDGAVDAVADPLATHQDRELFVADVATPGNLETWLGPIIPIAALDGPFEGQSPVTLDGSGSFDLNGHALTYAWDFDDDGVFDDAVGAKPEFASDAAGTFPIAVKVTDPDGLSSVAEGEVTVEEPDAPAPKTQLQRLGGSDRVVTAVVLSQRAFAAADAAVLARADIFADAVTGSSLAAEVNGPLLLTPTDGVRQEVLDELDRLGVETVYVLGGEDALSSDVEADLKAAGYDVVRRGGEDRFETAGLIAETVIDLGGPIDEVVIARGTHPDPSVQPFVDALTSGDLATWLRAPILLTPKDELDEATRSYLEEILETGGTLWVAGGDEAVSDEVLDQLEAEGYAPQRLAGEDRYETGLAIVEETRDQVIAGGGVDPIATVVLASGDSLVDSLAGAVVAHALGGVLLPVPSDTLDRAPALRAWLEENASDIATVIIAGESEAVSMQVQSEVAKALD